MTDFQWTHPVTQQPDGAFGSPAFGLPVAIPPGGDGGPVTVRIMTENDVDFVARCGVESFRDKMIWAVGESR